MTRPAPPRPPARPDPSHGPVLPGQPPGRTGHRQRSTSVSGSYRLPDTELHQLWFRRTTPRRTITPWNVEDATTTAHPGIRKLELHSPRCLTVTGNHRDNATDLLEPRSEEHTSELQSRGHLVCRLLLEKKNTIL